MRTVGVQLSDERAYATSAGEMLADLKRLRRNSSSTRVEAAVDERIPAKRRKLLWASLTATALIIIATTAAFVWHTRSDGLFLAYLGRADQAILQLQRAVELDPLNLKNNDNLGLVNAIARRDDAAIEQYKKTLDMDPNFASAHGNLAGTYQDVGKYDLWLQEWKKAAMAADDKEDLSRHR